MKKIFSFLFVFCFALPIFAQNIKQVPIFAEWKIGDEFSFKVIKEQNKSGNAVSNEYGFTITVVDSTADGYRLKLTYDDYFESFNNPAFQDSVFQNMDFSKFNIEELYTIYYRTDVLGGSIEIENWEEYLNKTLSISEDILKQVYDDENIIKQGLQITRNQYENDPNNIIPDAELIHYYLGSAVSIAPTKEKVYIPLFYGNIKAISTTAVTEYNDDTKYCKIENTTSLSEKDAKKAIQSLFKSIGLSVPKDVFKNAKLSILDNRTSEYISNQGIPLKIVYTRGTVANIDGAKVENSTTTTILNQKYDKIKK